MNPAYLHTAFTGVLAAVALISFFYARRQVREARKARVLAAYLTFESRLTSPERAKIVDLFTKIKANFKIPHN